MIYEQLIEINDSLVMMAEDKIKRLNSMFEQVDANIHFIFHAYLILLSPLFSSKGEFDSLMYVRYIQGVT